MTPNHHSKPWLPAAVYLLILYLTLPVMPLLVRSLFTLIGRDQFTQLLNLSLVFVALAIALRLWRLAPDHRLQITAPILATGYIALLQENPVERIHFLQYAILGVLVLWALQNRSPTAFKLGFLLVTGAGLLDEVIQWFLPNRYWDPRDVAMNAIGGALGLWLARFLLSFTKTAQTD